MLTKAIQTLCLSVTKHEIEFLRNERRTENLQAGKDLESFQLKRKHLENLTM
jgi:hypothetical protein